MAKFSEPTGPDTQTTLATRNHERDEDQRGIDSIVAPKVAAWVAAGKPAPSALTADMTVRLQCPKGDKTELKKMLRRAYLIVKAEPAWFKDTEPDAQGNIVVKSGPQVLKPKATPLAGNGETPAEQATTEQADQPQPQADQGGDQPQAEQPRPRGPFARR